MAGYFNDGNGVKNITDGYFYDGDVKYYKDVVTTKYWKETTTETTGLTYACYRNTELTGIVLYAYVKMPIGSESVFYQSSDMTKLSTTSAELTSSTAYITLDENKMYYIATGAGMSVPYNYYRYTAGDLYETVQTTEVVEGTADDYTYTTEETVTVEVSADEDYDYKEYYPKKIKQIYKVINGEAKLIFNNE